MQATHCVRTHCSQDLVPRLVSDSVAGRLWPKAHACMARLRAAAVEHARPGAFNSLLKQVCALCVVIEQLAH